MTTIEKLLTALLIWAMAGVFIFAQYGEPPLAILTGMLLLGVIADGLIYVTFYAAFFPVKKPAFMEDVAIKSALLILGLLLAPIEMNVEMAYGVLGLFMGMMLLPIARAEKFKTPKYDVLKGSSNLSHSIRE